LVPFEERAGQRRDDADAEEFAGALEAARAGRAKEVG
jgi:hypothetical protein